MKLFFAYLILAANIVAGLSACTDAERSQWEALGSKFQITLYAANGVILKQWISTGKVHAESNSDGWYFRRADTGKLERVSGTVDIEQLD